MKKSSQQHNRSALITAGQNSLYYQPNYQQNQTLGISDVRQVYKRTTTQSQDYERQRQQKYMKSSKYQIQKKNHKIRSIGVDNPLNSDRYQRQNYPYQQQKHQQEINQTYPIVSHLQMNSNNKYYQSPSKNANKKSSYNYHPNTNNYREIEDKQLKKLMMKLTLPRLRKMQALVRGFLVRRTIYPPLLQQYIIAKSVYDLILANVMYKEISSLIMEAITFPKYETGQNNIVELYKGTDRMLEQQVYDMIIKRIIKKQLGPVVQQSIISKGLLMSRPQITFGFNIRNPLQLLLYDRLMNNLRVQLKSIAEQSIQQTAEEKRQLFIMDTWIQKYQMLKPLYEQIANQVLEQSIGQYIVENIVENITKQGVFVIAQKVYTDHVNQLYFKEVESLKEQTKEMILQEAICQAILQLGYGMQVVQKDKDRQGR